MRHDLENVFARELHQVADGVRLPEGDLGAVLARGGRRRRRRRALHATSILAAAAVVAGVVGIQLRPDEGREMGVATTAYQLRRGDTGVVWRHGDTANALADARTEAIGDTLYALSTAPGPADLSSRTQPPKVLYRSDDGVDWAPVDRNGGVSFLADLSTRGERLYGVGTTTASVRTTTGKDVPDVAIHWTDDQARSWHRTMLAIDVDAIAAKSSSVQIGSLSVAAGDRGIVAVAGVTAQLDLATVLPAGASAPNGWAVGDSGIDILGAGPACPGGTTSRPGAPAAPPTTVRPVPGEAGVGQVRGGACYREDGTQVLVTAQQARGVTRSFTWAELGISGDLLRAVQGVPTVFWSSDGSSFERVDAPLASLSSAQVTTAGAGFVIVAQQSGAAGSRVVALRSSDGRRWTSSAATAGRLFATSLGEVAGRVTMVGTGEAGPTVAFLEGGGWRTGALSDVAETPMTDRTGVVASAVGPLGIIAVVQDVADGQGKPDIAYRLMFSRDGETWSNTPLTDLVDGPVARIGNVMVTDSRIIVTVIPAGGATPPDHATVIIGTV